VSIKNYTFKKPSFDHIFIDEVQDRTPIEINILKKIQKK
jgi:superfamily I DNA/RNA helicase